VDRGSKASSLMVGVEIPNWVLASSLRTKRSHFFSDNAIRWSR
jgi:hypothetical protein